MDHPPVHRCIMNFTEYINIAIVSVNSASNIIMFVVAIRVYQSDFIGHGSACNF